MLITIDADPVVLMLLLIGITMLGIIHAYYRKKLDA